MERYTKRLEDGQAVMDCPNCPESWNTNPEGKCTALYCRNRLKDRLAAYEDTGLEPEEIEKAMDIVKSAVSAFEDFGVDRLAELAQADREGRCLVLPRKIGDSVWRLYGDCYFPGECHAKRKCKNCEYLNLFVEEQAFRLSMLKQNGKLEPPYYSSYEDAQAALRREQNGE